MKVLILGFSKIKYMPYLNFYLGNMSATKNDIHLIYWNRDLKPEDTSFLKGITLHEFNYYQEDDAPKFKKIKSFINYRKFVLEVLNQNNFDFIIALHTLPGVLVVDKLKKYFSEKYIFDYRDYTYEYFYPFKKIVHDLVNHSYVTFVSSDAFRMYLPNTNKILTSHNLLLDSLSHRNEKEKFGISSNKIRISFWGFIRNEECNNEIIKKIAADNRFELHYYGREQQVAKNLKKFVQENNFQNVFFHGEYKPEDRYKFVRQTDIIHNIYCDKNMMLAMSNKYYDGVIFRIPQICMTGSHMAKKVSNAKIGLACNPYNDDFTEQIYQYYKSINTQVFYKNCDIELQRINNEYCSVSEMIKNIFCAEQVQ